MGAQSAILKLAHSISSKISAWVKSHRLWSVGITVVIISLSCVIVVPNKSIANAITMGTTHQPERVTELYFTDYNAIETQITVKKQYFIPFTVVNHEARPTTYTYETSAIEGAKSTPLSSGTLTLIDGQAGHATVNFTPTTPGTTYQISIKLTNVNQEINVRLKS